MSFDVSNITDSLLSALGKAGESTILGVKSVKDKIEAAAGALAKEAQLGPQLHEQALGALERMQEENTSLKPVVAKAFGYAVFPSAARAAPVVGLTYGMGVVFENARPIGYAGMVQMTAGVQLGGSTLHMLVVFDNEDALELFKAGKISFAANASATLVKAGAIAGRSPSGLRVFVYSEGGEMLEAAIGEQTFRFVPAALGRLRHGPEHSA
jgi:lipid-binding SYLF domain-containing protein